MSIKTINYFLLLFLIFVGCTDSITSHYPTRAEAEADNLFERGWLPSLIPVSSRDITTSNDIDINTSEGEFYFDQKETTAFLKCLMPYSDQKPKLDRWQSYITDQKKEGYSSYTYATNKRFWVFLVNTGTSHVRYVMWLQ